MMLTLVINIKLCVYILSFINSISISTHNEEEDDDDEDDGERKLTTPGKRGHGPWSNA